MWWDVYVPKVVAEEHLREVDRDWQRIVDAKSAEIKALRLLEARLYELQNSTGWRFVLWWQDWFAKHVDPHGRLGLLLQRAFCMWLNHGATFLVRSTTKRTFRFLLKRLRLLPSSAPIDLPAQSSTDLSEPVIEVQPAGDSIAEPIDQAMDDPRADEALVPSVPARSVASPRMRVYTSSLGNYFFGEIRDLICAGLRQLGLEVCVHDETDGFVGGESDWHMVLAPHEFFCLGAGNTLASQELPANLILINTEQPSTHWFKLAADFFPKARWIWDIDYLSAQRLAHRGLKCQYLPLGFVPQFEAFVKQRDLPSNYGTNFLEPQVRFRSRLDEPLSVRPIDLAFFGNITTRREAFFNATAADFAKYRTYFYFSDGSRPLLQGHTTHMNTATVVGLVQRSKILLNIHRDADRYFESHRIVMHGIWQKALVISEPCSPAPPFRPGIDYVEAPLDDIARKVEYYLSDPIGRRDAQDIVEQGFRTLSRDCQLADVLRPLIEEVQSDTCCSEATAVRLAA